MFNISKLKNAVSKKKQDLSNIGKIIMKSHPTCTIEQNYSALITLTCILVPNFQQMKHISR